MFTWLKKIRLSGNVSEENDQVHSCKKMHPVAHDLQEKCAVLRKMGNEFLSMGKLAEAEDAYRQAIDIDPQYADGLVNLGFVLRSQDQTAEAEQYLKQALAIDPKIEDAYFILGEILQSRGDLVGAIENYRKALQLKPGFEHVYNNLYNALAQYGQDQDAREVLDQAIVLFPNSVEFNFHKGNSFADEKDWENAIVCYKKTLSFDAGYYPALVHLGNAFKEHGNPDAALLIYQKALEINPEASDIHNNLGAFFQDRGDFVQAENFYRKAIDLNPNLSEVYNNLAGMLITQGRLEEAIISFKQALAINPDSAEIHNNLGKGLRRQLKLAEAEMEFRKAIQLDPDYYDAFNNLGTALRDQGRHAEAIENIEQAVRIKPDFIMAQNNLGVIFQEQGNLEKALVCFKQALVFDPDLAETKVNLLYMALYLNDWKELHRLSQEARQAIREEPAQKISYIAPFSFLAIPGSTASEQQICSRNCAQRISRAMQPWQGKLGFEFKRERKHKIKLGYLSADYRNHPVAHLMSQIFTLHDRECFHVSAYSIGPNDGTGMRERLQTYFDEFIDLRNMTDVDAARKIYADEVDILINLTGYTQHSRSEILALRPAPLQVNYLGYPGTLGADFIDYLIADQFIIPPQYKQYYTEEVLWLPDSYMPRDSTVKRLAAPRRTDCGLPENGFVFCSFNQPYKITPEVFDVWCQLLKAVPGSVLWLPSYKPETEENLGREAWNRGVSADRIIRAPRADLMEEHLARLQCADLFLDTTPYNAHTTCSDALWMGLPVITCTGETFSSRVAGSLLTAIGAPELITYNLEDYYTLALSLATNREKYQQVRAKVVNERDTAPVFDSRKFTQDLERLYEEIWGKFLSKSRI